LAVVLVVTIKDWHVAMILRRAITIAITLTGKRLRGIVALRIETSDDGEDVLDVTDHGFAPSVRVRQVHSHEALGG